MARMTDGPYLLTPGPLTTSPETRAAMQRRDWGSRDGDFIMLTRRVRDRLCRLAGAERTHSCVLLQGSGTFAVEATIQTLLPREGALLVLVNGAYGRRMVEIARRLGRKVSVLDSSEERPVDPAEVAARLDREPDITHVALVHCETTSGVLNPLAPIAGEVAQRGKRLLLDAMSSFGALPIDAREVRFDALVAASGKCLEGVPGMGFVFLRKAILERCAGNSQSLAMDLHDQHQYMEKTGQWRFTPPTHVIAAFGAALDAHEAEGGVAGRGARYRRNCRALVEGMRALGFRPLLPDALQAPIIVTFAMPRHPAFRFAEFYDRLHARGFVIYPGKLMRAESFRIGCIGSIGEAEIRAAVDAVASVLGEMGVPAGQLAG
jgi:2-aminoethylphosphonate-pyruvate transaminase